MKNATGRPIRLLITGGGTGGHLFPAVAAAQALRLRQPESEVLFIGTRRKIDTTTLDGYGFASCSIHSYGLKGKSPLELLKAIAALPVSIFQAAVHIRRFRPDVALGVGGYVTGPVMVAAKLMGVPTIIHEQNSVPGLANRKLGTLVNRICVSLPGSERFFPLEKTILTGNPVRQNILALAREEKDKSGVFTIMILGGSQGAHAVNRLVTEALCDYGKENLPEFAVIHQTGQKDAEWVENRYREAGVNATVAPFFRDMAEVYSKADLLVSRAGATTLTELAVLGKPAILVPYPFAADDHQTKNGAYYVDGGGAVQFIEKDLHSELLFRTIEDLMKSGDRRAVMAEGMRGLAIPDAAEKIVDVCLQAAGGTMEPAIDTMRGN
ncbi:undecaprenyldiphospho-muramoylpentapeptide beta-N-acetylglucosaminyltransferase [Desulfopila aestuarii]|uniref:UDP-N-acetylglucosamine--N-acetylmuramyl-(pentapeptide) pyrophosphoryl-undecaprenol N-acetylglucosamine transferase n=1 Tax=Desulfopila aestuarii DSM 18488 TaxID=1121416 RepID=A0A1M7XZ91_9BACT|nr:undecaprenyldiphospho-muramoylpentapeptide beta-N-acetylglucosaminyltransferase [Desulfopila aestuarii]SHO44433.1 UDP-N-acetylglucosamine-N-acetylmuramylpentapeptide N-acetylglucosamine transferase [Desulfopila aestuarii DSM 18488]